MRHLTKEEKNSTGEIIPVARNEKESYFKSVRVRAVDQIHRNIKIRFLSTAEVYAAEIRYYPKVSA